MSSFSRFQESNKQRTIANQKLNSKFVICGYNSTIITNTKKDEEGAEITLPAAVVNQQEKDKAYIYTFLKDPLDIGSCWTVKGLTWLISEEIVVIKDVNWHKYLAFLCNINLDDVWGYFIGPEETYINVKNEKNAILDSQQKPILVLPSDILGFEDKIVIKGRPWLIQEYDKITTPGIVYYSLVPTTVSNDIAAENEGKEVYIERKQPVESKIITEPEATEEATTFTIGNDINIIISTYDGYFVASEKVDVKKHTFDQVIFSIPFGVNEVTIDTKQDAETILSTLYKVGENK